MGKYRYNPFTGKLDLASNDGDFLKKLGDTAAVGADFTFPFSDFTSSFKIKGGDASGIEVKDNLTNTVASVSQANFITQDIGTGQRTSLTPWYSDFFDSSSSNRFRFYNDSWSQSLFRASAEINTRGLQLWGRGSNGSNFMLVFGDQFGLDTPYTCIMEDGGTDSDQLMVYGQKGVGLYAGTWGGTPKFWVDTFGRRSLTSKTANSFFDLEAGTTTNATMRMVDGSLLTTPQVGAWEYTSNRLYFTPLSTSARHRVHLDNEYVHTVAGNITLDLDRTVCIINKAVGAATTVTLPASPLVKDRYLIVDGKGDANANNITIQGNGKNINGSASRTINTAYGGVEVFYNGTQWNVINTI